MLRIDGTDRTTSLPTPPSKGAQDGFFRPKNAGIGQLGTIVPFYWMNFLQESLRQARVDAGVAEPANWSTFSWLTSTINALALAVVNANATAIPPGLIYPYAGSSAPTGYLLCYGQAVSRTTYSGLFAIVGTTYGSGDGSTTFNLPDLRQRTPIGKGDMGGSNASRITSASVNGSNSTTLGGTGGAETHTLSVGEIPSHSHTYDTANSLQSVSSGGSNNYASTVSSNTGSTGGGGAHSNTQPWIALNYIIKT